VRLLLTGYKRCEVESKLMLKRKHVDRMHRQVALTKSNYNITRLPAEAKAITLVKQAKDHLAAKQDVVAIKTLTAALKADLLHIEALILQAN